MKKGFTLVEIIVSVIILALVILGMLSVFVGGTKHTVHSRERLVSAEVGKLFIDQMQGNVRQDTWDSAANPLTITAAPQPLGTQVLNNRSFTGTYMTSAVTGSEVRRVTVTVDWTEPTS